jgi:hypothetical protein
MREELFAKIDLQASRLKPYEGFIFLCGGQTDVLSHEPVSIRDAMCRELAKDSVVKKRIRVAEHYKDWSHDSIYQDLVSFERHLAELSSVIVLVLESSGSIAELGLFSVVEEFQGSCSSSSRLTTIRVHRSLGWAQSTTWRKCIATRPNVIDGQSKLIASQNSTRGPRKSYSQN